MKRGLPIALIAILQVSLATPLLAQQEADYSSEANPEITVTAEPSESDVVGNVVQNRRSYLQTKNKTNTLTEDFGGGGSKLNDRGINFDVDLWLLYQANVAGGIEHDETFNGLAYFSGFFDLEKMTGWRGASFFARVDSRSGGTIDPAVGSLTSVNTLAVGDETIGFTRVWLQQNLYGDRVQIKAGKMDITTENFSFHGQNTAFDAMDMANSPRSMFLAGALVNNSAIPFPESGMAAMALVEPVDRWYIAGGAVPSNSEEYDWSNPFGSDTPWLYTGETGTVLSVGDEGLAGHYYAGVWSSEFEDAPRGKGLYVGASQMFSAGDGGLDGGIGAFFRYGYAEGNPSGIDHFLSIGGQYHPKYRRNERVVGIGWAQAFTSGPGFTAPYEGVLETYYRIAAVGWLHLTPHIQYIVNPGSQDVPNALTFGLRGQVAF